MGNAAARAYPAPVKDIKPRNKKRYTAKHFSGHEVIPSPRDLKSQISYREIGPGVTNPTQNAEMQLSFLEGDFKKWLKADIDRLNKSWGQLRKTPDNPKFFIEFTKAVHIILGNAALLNSPATGELACPLSRLLERTPNIEHHIEVIDLAVAAMAATSTLNKQTDNEQIAQIKSGIATIIDRWIMNKR